MRGTWPFKIGMLDLCEGMRHPVSMQSLIPKSQAFTLLGMSGVGKTTLANKLPRERWFHYSGDYRIGTRYLGEAIHDDLYLAAMALPRLAALLLSEGMVDVEESHSDPCRGLHRNHRAIRRTPQSPSRLTAPHTVPLPTARNLHSTRHSAHQHGAVG